jgi:predicted KAP-like P-loop ATPase
LSDELKDELRDIATALDRSALAAGEETDATRLGRSLTPDEPIRSSKEDRLNRSGFATQLAQAIVDFDRTDSVVVGIHGRWGTGKTSLMNLIEEKLQTISREAPVIFRFNPWGFSDQEQLTMRFFGDLAAFLRLHMSIPPLAGVSETVEEYGELLSPMARLMFPRATEAVRVGWTWFRKLKPTRKKNLAELRVHINSGLRDSGSKLIIMIDDIDRLNAMEIRQVFQLIKLNANFSNTVYVVAFDKVPVEKALREVAPGPPREYLEKIVQISFNLPPIHEATLTEIIVANVNDILTSFGIENLDQQRFGNMFQSGFRKSFRTIRDVNRYFNLFRFALNLMHKDTDFIDLAAVEALAIFYPSVYHSIEANPEMFCGGWRASEERREKEAIRTMYEKVFLKLTEPRRKAAVSLCEFLFPKMERVYGALNSTYGPEWEQTWQKTRRIAASKYFPYYFQLAVPDTDVSQSELDKALGESTSVAAFVEILRRFKASKRFAAFIDRLRDHLGSLRREQLLILLESIFIFGDEVETEGAALFGLISEYIRFGMWFLFDILDLLPSDRFEMLCQVMLGRPAAFTISDVTSMFVRIVSGEGDSASLRSRYPDLNEETVIKMKSIAIDAIDRAAQENRLQSVPRLGGVLFRWREWGDPKQVSAWVLEKFLSTPRGAISFISSFEQTSSSMGMRDRVPKTWTSIPIQAIAEFADLDILAGLLRNARDEELSEKERKTKELFLSAKAKLDSGQSPEGRFPPDDDRVV